MTYFCTAGARFSVIKSKCSIFFVLFCAVLQWTELNYAVWCDASFIPIQSFIIFFYEFYHIEDNSKVIIDIKKDNHNYWSIYNIDLVLILTYKILNHIQSDCIPLQCDDSKKRISSSKKKIIDKNTHTHIFCKKKFSNWLCITGKNYAYMETHLNKSKRNSNEMQFNIFLWKKKLIVTSYRIQSWYIYK